MHRCAVVTAHAPAAVPPAPTFATREEPRHRAIARYLWARLLARIYEALPLSCPICHSQMRIIAFINDTGTVGKILNHIGESTQPPRIAPARGPPLWVAAAEQAENDREWDSSAPERTGDRIRSAHRLVGGGDARAGCLESDRRRSLSGVNGFANPTETGAAKKAGMVFAASEPGQGRAQPGEANP